MKLIGFNFTKINVERFGGSGKEIKVNTAMDISNIEKADVDFLMNKEDVLVVKFKYSLDFEPKFAKIEFEGSIILSLDSKQAKEALKEWKDKKVSDNIKLFVFSVILRKSNVKALQLEDEMGLPFHIPMPKISQEKKDKENN